MPAAFSSTEALAHRAAASPALAAGAGANAALPWLARGWPLPALLCWAIGWGLMQGLLSLHAPRALAFAAALLPALALAGWQPGRLRRIVLCAGQALACLWLPDLPAVPATHDSHLTPADAGAWPHWPWLLPLAVLLLLYPLRAWRDAPLFPTPPGALDRAAARIALAPGARVLDAGCGHGAGLRALRRAWPQAAVEGVEWSAALAWIARLRCPWARVRRGDLWRDDWSDCALVYLFQRPESMPRAWRKAQGELPAGAWLASLEFAVPGQRPTLRLSAGGGRTLWLYRMEGLAASRRKGRRTRPTRHSSRFG